MSSLENEAVNEGGELCIILCNLGGDMNTFLSDAVGAIICHVDIVFLCLIQFILLIVWCETIYSSH